MTKKGSKKDKSNSNRGSGTSAQYNAVAGTDTDTSIIEVAPSPSPPRRTGNKKKKNSKRDDDSDDDESNPLERKPSPVIAPLPTLNDQEYVIFEKVTAGDLDGVRGLIGNMNINKTNKFGYTVLHIAVKSQDEEMVKFLLGQSGIQILDTVLHAVREGNKEITDLLLSVHDKEEHDDKKQRFMSSLGGNAGDSELEAVASSTGVHSTSSPISPRSGVKSSFRRKERPRFGPPPKQSTSSKSPRSNIPSSSVTTEGEGDEIPFDSEFPPVVTPLMLAAQGGNYALMDLFYSRNERLETPEFHHNLGCDCDICAKLDGDQDMTRALQRYQLFKSICKPEYICFMARKEKIDPVNYAIDKILKLRKICERDMAYDRTYEPFIGVLEGFLKDLVSLCRNNLETEIFLSPKDSAGKERLPHMYPRLWYAVGLELRPFVAQPNVQNIVYKMWATDDWPDWETYGFLYRLFQLFIRCIGFLVIVVILWAAPSSKVGRGLGSPVSRFMTYLAMYMIFLAIVTFQVLFPYQRCNGEDPPYQIDDEHCKQRGPPRIGTEWPIIIFTIGFYISTIKKSSVSWFWSSRWNWIDIACQLSFTATIVCWGLALLWIEQNRDLEFATDRLMWPHDCAEIYGECFIAVAVMLAYARLLQFLVLFPTAGPIQIGLGKQVVDFLGAGLIYVAVLFAFASGLLALYTPYKGFQGYDADNKMATQDDTFTTIAGTMKNLFWYLYGHAGKEPTTLLSWDPYNSSDPEERIHHDFTEYTGLALYLAYHVIGSMMMFPMLSGYFSQTMGSMQKDMDTHWKFARTELYLTYIKETVLPPPFNIAPTVIGFARFVKFMSLIGKKEDPKAACSLKQCCYITEDNKHGRWKKLMKGYRKLILELMYRYGNFKEEEEGHSAASRDDVLEIREELTQLKAMLNSSKDGGGSDSSSDDDDIFRPGAGLPGSKKSKAWSKAKSAVTQSGSTYLRNVTRSQVAGGSGGAGGGSAITSQPGTSAGIMKSQSSMKEARSSPQQSVPRTSSKSQISSPLRKSSSGKASSGSRSKDKATGSGGITTVLPPKASTPATTATTAQTVAGDRSNRNVPSRRSLPKTKSAPLEKTVASLASAGKSAPAITRSNSQGESSSGKIPTLPKPLSMRTTTADDSETTDGMSPTVIRSLSKLKPGV